jgi:hypothetical protein
MDDYFEAGIADSTGPLPRRCQGVFVVDRGVDTKAPSKDPPRPSIEVMLYERTRARRTSPSGQQYRTTGCRGQRRLRHSFFRRHDRGCCGECRLYSHLVGRLDLRAEILRRLGNKPIPTIRNL